MTNEEWYDAEVAPKLKQLAHAIQALRTISNKGREHPDPYIEGSWFAEIAETALCKVEDGDGEKSLRAQLARASQLLLEAERLLCESPLMAHDNDDPNLASECHVCQWQDKLDKWYERTETALREAGAAEGGEGK